MNAIKHDYRDLIPTGNRIDTIINNSMKCRHHTPHELHRLIAHPESAEDPGKKILTRSAYTAQGIVLREDARQAAEKSLRKTSLTFPICEADYDHVCLRIILLIPQAGGFLVGGRFDHYRHKTIKGHSLNLLTSTREENAGIDLPRWWDGEAYNNPGKTIYDEGVNRSAVKAMKEASRVISTGYPFTCVLYYFELPETQETENRDERAS